MFRTQLLRTRSNRKGFTLIELLVVVLILATLMAVSMPLYLSAVADSQKKTCRANMQTIANAAQSARVKSGANDFAAIITANSSAISLGSLADLNAIPACPNAGVYTLVAGTGGNTSFKVTCTTTPDQGHGTFEPGVDSK